MFGAGCAPAGRTASRLTARGSQVIFMIPSKPPPVLAHPERWSPAFIDFLGQCLAKNPSERPSAKQLLEVRRPAEQRRPR